MQILKVASNILKVSFRDIAPIHNKSHLMTHNRWVRPKPLTLLLLKVVLNLFIKRDPTFIRVTLLMD